MKQIKTVRFKVNYKSKIKIKIVYNDDQSFELKHKMYAEELLRYLEEEEQNKRESRFYF